MLFTHYSDKILSDLQNLIDEFNANLEKSLLFITEEHLLVQHFKEFVQQSKYLENMDEKIALRIGRYHQRFQPKYIKNLFYLRVRSFFKYRYPFTIESRIQKMKLYVFNSWI